MQLGPDVRGLGLLIGEVARAGCAVELSLPREVIVDLEDNLLSLLLFRHELVLDLVHVFSPAVGHGQAVGSWLGMCTHARYGG